MNNDFFVIANVSPGKLNALVKNIMKQIGINDPNEAVRMVNAEEVQISVVKSKWAEKDSVIYFSVTSDGTTGKQWIARLESEGFCVGGYAKSILRSKNFKPTNSITYKVAVLKGRLFGDSERTTKNVYEEAKNRKLVMPNAEIACLIRKKFSDKELEDMGFSWIVVAHKPIKDSDGDPSLLLVSRMPKHSCLDVYCSPIPDWSFFSGFAFIINQFSNIKTVGHEN